MRKGLTIGLVVAILGLAFIPTIVKAEIPNQVVITGYLIEWQGETYCVCNNKDTDYECKFPPDLDINNQDDLIDYLKDQGIYHSHDEDYVYIKATLDGTEFEPDANGSDLMKVSIDLLLSIYAE